MPDSNTTVIWQPKRTVVGAPGLILPPLLTAIGRGLLCRCPVCGEGRVFNGYLSVVPACSVCGAPLGRARPDDAPPYLTIFIIGHIVVLGMLWLEQAYSPQIWVHAVIWLPLTLFGSLLLLRPIKGGVVGLTMKLGLMRDSDDAA